MALNLGVHVHEKATSLSTPVTADVGIPFVVGTAPVHTAAKPAKPNTPVLCASWDEAVEKLGFSEDWKNYTLCEFMYSHFQLFGCQPVIFCNVLDTDTMKTEDGEKNYTVSEHKALLPFAMLATLTVKNGESVLTPDEDYTVFYDGDNCIVELLPDGSAYGAGQLDITGSAVNPGAVNSTGIVSGLAQVDSCMNSVGVVPDLICAPGWSHESVVAAVMATKAEGINGLFRAKALIDADCGETGVREYSELLPWKNGNNIVDENQILCWPMVKLGDYQFHMSTQLAGLMASVDAGNGGVPYESPATKISKWTAAAWPTAPRSI